MENVSNLCTKVINIVGSADKTQLEQTESYKLLLKAIDGTWNQEDKEKVFEYCMQDSEPRAIYYGGWKLDFSPFLKKYWVKIKANSSPTNSMIAEFYAANEEVITKKYEKVFIEMHEIV